VAAARTALPVPQEHSKQAQLSEHILSSLARYSTASAPPCVPPGRSRYAPRTQPAWPPRLEKVYKKVYNEYQEDIYIDDNPNLSGPYEGESQSIDTVLSLDCHQASLEFAPPAAEVRCARQGGLREP